MQPRPRAIRSVSPKTSQHETAQPQSTSPPNTPNTDSPAHLPPDEKAKVPGFVTKLYRILSDSSLSHLIRWSPSGTSFVVTRPEEFAQRVLPTYFKHNNFSSLVRQLNLYGFRKVHPAGSGTGLGQEHVWGFAHDDFLRDHPERMVLVKRKASKAEDASIPGLPFEPGMDVLENGFQGDTYSPSLARLHSELRSLRAHQLSMQNELSSLQVESQRVWMENQLMRNRANQQQELIDRIIRFLASMFSGTDATRNLMMPDFLNTPGIQNVLHRYQGTGGLTDPLYPTAPAPVLAGQKRLLPWTGDEGTDHHGHAAPFQESFTNLGDSIADQMHDLDDIQDRINKLGDEGAVIRGEEIPDDISDIMQYLDEYPVEEALPPKNHD